MRNGRKGGACGRFVLDDNVPYQVSITFNPNGARGNDVDFRILSRRDLRDLRYLIDRALDDDDAR